ncbi:MAG: integrase arm-type DNA-binding domain-containing protein [Deltaproteobacteria bacterium]|nr:integrase arm-type DNA-binding domain-containing protein [Deltaproteobacteria bacterium]
MPLTDIAIRNAKPKKESYRLWDGGGLNLEISPTGNKWWRLKYRFNGKEKRLSFGVYPDVTLKDAREKRDQARRLLAADTDPSENRKAVRAARVERFGNSFEVIARERFAKLSLTLSDEHRKRIIRGLEKDVFPWIGERPVTEVTAPQLLSVLRRIEERGAMETAHRTLQYCGQVFRYAIQTARADHDPSRDLHGALSPVKKSHLAAITDPKAVGQLLRAIDGYEGYFVTKCSLRLAPLVFLRPGELRGGEWSEIDFEKAEWNIPAGRMKMREPHLVPLSRQAIEILRELHALTNNSRFLFPSARTNIRPMSNNAILAALRRMGYTTDEMTGHGFRAMARTILDEVLGVRPDFIEHQLAHAVHGPLGRAYNRTSHLPERRKMMQQWADYLDDLKAGAKVIPLNGRVA